MQFAVDTNVLLDQALGNEDVLDALDIIRKRVPGVRFVVTPTVLQELAFQAQDGPEAGVRAAAITVLGNLLKWGYQPLNLIPVGHGIVQSIGFKMRAAGIIPDDEVHDSEIIAEAALIDCTVLLSSDHHLLEAQAGGLLSAFLDGQDVTKITIGSPRMIVSRFMQRD